MVVVAAANTGLECILHAKTNLNILPGLSLFFFFWKQPKTFIKETEMRNQGQAFLRTLERNIIMTPILQKKKLRHRGIKNLPRITCPRVIVSELGSS